MAHLYISGALTGAPRGSELKRLYKAIARACERHGHTAYLPHEHTDPAKHPTISAAEVYDRDRQEVLRATMLIAYVGVPSLGVGTELEIAKANGIPIALLYEEVSTVSRAARGNPGVRHQVAFSDSTDAIRQLDVILTALSTPSGPTQPPWYNGINQEYKEQADYLARVIVSQSVGIPAAILSRAALAHLQDDTHVCPFWRQTAAGGGLELVPLSDLREPATGTAPMHASFDVHVGFEMVTIDHAGNPDSVHYHQLPATPPAIVPPGAIAMIKSREYVGMPQFLAGVLVSPVGAAMSGLSNISTMIDPMFQGFLLLNFVNNGPLPIEIYPGRVISRIVFYMVAPVDVANAELYERSHHRKMYLREMIEHRLAGIEKTVNAPNLVAVLREALPRMPK